MLLPSQSTLKNEITCKGVGLHTGKEVSMILQPAEEDHGIVFVRDGIKIKACYSNVVNTQLGTVIGDVETGATISTIEHFLAACWGCKLDNLLVNIDGPEVPIFDGSSSPFVFAIESAGLLNQNKARNIIEIIRPIEIKCAENKKFIKLYPSDTFSVDIKIDFDSEFIGEQEYKFNYDTDCFKGDIARARTFGFRKDFDKLKNKGFARGASLENAIAVGENGVINPEGLRHKKEFVLHKLLDCFGDWFLCGGYLKGHFEAFCPGHMMNNTMLRTIFSDKDNYRIIKLSEHMAH